MARLLFILVLLGIFPAHGFDQSYWVWQRSAPLRPPEVADLRAADVRALYWHVGMLKWDGTTWRWIEHVQLGWAMVRASCPGVEIIPVVRLEAGPAQTLPPPSRAPLIALLNRLATDSGAPMLQIDYESPDRLIGEYADFLRELKDSGRPWRLSISALGHWSRFASELAVGADEITPMFYDLNPSLERLGKSGMPSLVDPTIRQQLAAWRGCPVPWCAGLPNFSRVTVLDAMGKSRGNLRNWSWDEIFFAPFLQPLEMTANGQVLFAVGRDAVLGFTPLKVGENIDVRYPDRAALRDAQLASAEAGAQGTVWFRLADSSDPSGYSVRDLGAEKAGAPAFTVKRDAAGRFVLTNTSSRDLMPVVRALGKDYRGYALELEARTPIWREAIPGDFARATSGETAPGSLGVTQLQFWFTHLPAGNSLTTGYIGESAPGPAAPVQWRIRNLEKEDLWHPLD